MKLPLSLLFIILVLPACQQATKKQVLTIQQEINQLKTKEHHKAYLTKIHEKDQGKREESQPISLEESIKVDALNINKIRAYLAKFGYPKKSEVGEIAAGTPILVFHHLPRRAGTYELKKQYLSMFMEAYRNEDIRDTGITFFLNRMYEDKYGKRMPIENPFTTEKEIRLLLEKLN